MCLRRVKSAERAHWDQVDAGLLVEWDTCASADTFLWFAGLIGVAPAMVDIARSSVYAEHSREQCKDYHGDRVRQLIPRIVVAEALARNRIQKPQSARGEADGQDLATAEGERS